MLCAKSKSSAIPSASSSPVSSSPKARWLSSGKSTPRTISRRSSLMWSHYITFPRRPINMSFRHVGIVYRKELTEWLRDRRTLISTVLVPLLAFPVLMVGMTSLMAVMMSKAEKEVPKVMVIHGENSTELVAALHASKDLEIVPYADDWKEQISNKQIRAAVEIPSGFDASLNGKSPLTVEIHYYQGEVKSEYGAGHVEDSLKAYRDEFVKKILEAKNLPDSLISPFLLERNNVAPPEKVSGAALGGLLGYMVILLSMTGAIYPAIDLTAGEKERGTMETILSSPISRLDLVLGKFFLVLTASLVTAALSVASMGISFWGLERLRAFDKAGSDAAQLQLHIGPATVLSVF